MSRINCIPPRELSGPHLVAEYRELPRIFGMMRRKQAQGLLPATLRLPRRYCFGTGHVSFFLDKGGWLLRRQHALIREMQRRGYHPTFTDPATLAAGLDPAWLGHWRPTPAACALNRRRIAERRETVG
ncbi:MAG TPA: pyrimidine dimer DNA glycosylase/endonuclease V [Terriglobales bacterium]